MTYDANHITFYARGRRNAAFFVIKTGAVSELERLHKEKEGVMPEDVKDVQQNPASDGKTAGEQAGGEKPKVFTEDEVRKAVDEALAQNRSTLERDWQSKKDREVAAERRKAQTLQKALETLKANGNTDVETVVDKATTESELGFYHQRDKESQQQEEARREWLDGLSQIQQDIQTWGVNPADKRLNEAFNKTMQRSYGDPKAQLRAIKEVMLSTARDIAKEDTRKSMSNEFDDRFANLRKELGLDSPGVAGASAPVGKGRKPTYDELRKATPDEYEKKVKSGEWVGV